MCMFFYCSGKKSSYLESEQEKNMAINKNVFGFHLILMKFGEVVLSPESTE